MALKAESWRTPIKKFSSLTHASRSHSRTVSDSIDPCIHRFIFCCRCVVELGADPDTRPNSGIEIGGVLWIICHKTSPISISQPSTVLWLTPNFLLQGMQKIAKEIQRRRLIPTPFCGGSIVWMKTMASFPAGLASQLEGNQGSSASEQQEKLLKIFIGFPDRTFSSCPA